MTQNLFTACRQNGSLVAKRVRLDGTIQSGIKDLFSEQENSFRNGIINVVDFNGSWSPEPDELLTIDIPQEAEIFEETINKNATSIPDIDTSNFCKEGIKALFTGLTVDGKTKVLVQRFTSQQMLERKFSLLQQGNAFRKLTEPAFTLDTVLTCIVEDKKIKFKSQYKLRSIIDMQNIYREATKKEVRVFCAHDKLFVANVDSFLEQADQIVRKLISAITHSGNLNYGVDTIKTAAATVGVEVTVEDNKIVMPETRADLKNLLRFLNDDLYEAALTGQKYKTNSKRSV